MVNVMITDVGREPGHDRAGFHEAGRFKRRLIIGPAFAVVKRDTREIVLRIKQVGADGAGNEMRNEKREQEGRPASEIEKDYCHRDVQQEGEQAVKVSARISQAGSDAHSVQENNNVAKKNRQRMPHVEVFETDTPRRSQVTGLGHDGEGADVRRAELRVVIVMIIMRTSPDRDGAETDDAERAHDCFSQAGMTQDRVVLLIVIDDEHPEEKEPAQNAANDSPSEVNVPEGARDGCNKKRTG